jgi:hypothetical protein
MFIFWANIKPYQLPFKITDSRLRHVMNIFSRKLNDLNDLPIITYEMFLVTVEAT